MRLSAEIPSRLIFGYPRLCSLAADWRDPSRDTPRGAPWAKGDAVIPRMLACPGIAAGLSADCGCGYPSAGMAVEQLQRGSARLTCEASDVDEGAEPTRDRVRELELAVHHALGVRAVAPTVYAVQS